MIKIETYKPEYKPYFEKYNRQWLEEFFEVEPIDEKYFSDPKGLIIDKGGRIFFAIFNDEVVGTCSLIKHDNSYELAKMGVDKNLRSKGIGDVLLKAVLAEAKDMGIKKIDLLTNSKLKAAIHLYEKHGFVHTGKGCHPDYERCDVTMILEFSRD